MTQSYDYTQDDVWDMEATKSGTGGDFEVCPPGNYPAQIVGLIDVGTHEEVNERNETYDSRKMVLAVEITKKTSKGQRFVLSKLFTWSMRDNSNWYKLVCSLTGKKFNEGERFDPRQVLGMPCMANVTKKESGKTPGKFFHILEGIAQYPDELPKPDGSQFRPAIAWSVRSNDPPPAMGWIPNVYFGNGMCSIEKIVNMSKESRGFIKGKPVSQSGNGADRLAGQVQEAIKAAPATVFGEVLPTDDPPF